MLQKYDSVPRAVRHENENMPVAFPADREEGIQLQVASNGQWQTVTVPDGGVNEGQIFQAQGMADVDCSGAYDLNPTGNWRDGLCDCCRFGCFHPMLCLGYWCHCVVAGQVMTRMSRNFMGLPGARPSVSNTCGIVTAISFCMFTSLFVLRMIMLSLNCLGGTLAYDTYGEPEYIVCPDGSTEEVNPATGILASIHLALGLLFPVYMLFAVCNTRAAMRRKYQIQASTCGECEDCCCTFWCTCCTIQQMARHTHDYATHSVGCCADECFNKRGQHEEIPEIDP